MKLRTHISDWRRPIPNLFYFISFHKRHFALSFSFTNLSSIPAFFTRNFGLFPLIFLWLCSDVANRSHTLQISTVIWLYFDQCIDCSVLFSFCFVFHFNTCLYLSLPFFLTFCLLMPMRLKMLVWRHQKKIVFPSFVFLAHSV